MQLFASIWCIMSMLVVQTLVGKTLFIIGSTVPSPWPYSCSAGLNISDLKVDMRGKVVFVTGSDGREGFPLSVAMLNAGAQLIAVSRDKQTAETNKQRLDQAMGGKANAEAFAIDLSSFASVRKGSSDILEKYSEIHVIAHVAATAGLNNVTADGLIETMQVNLFSPALITNLLRPALHAVGGDNGRVVHVSSANCFDPLGWPAHGDEVAVAMARSRGTEAPPAGSTPYYFYSFSKFLLTHYAAELAKRDQQLTSFSVNPGFFRDDPSKYADMCKPQLMWTPCPQYPTQGATSTLFAAAQKGIDHVSGTLFDFQTNLTTQSPYWVQSGDTCIPRALPPWTSEFQSRWFDTVEAVVHAAQT